jgi:hypothetical protein
MLRAIVSKLYGGNGIQAGEKKQANVAGANG